MTRILPEPKHIALKNESSAAFSTVGVLLDTVGANAQVSDNLQALLDAKFRDRPGLKVVAADGAIEQQANFILRLTDARETIDRLTEGVDLGDQDRFEREGYALEVDGIEATLAFHSYAGLVNGISTFKQLLEHAEGGGYTAGKATIADYPSVLVRSISTTFAWYAGYGQIGFDSQL